MTGDRGTDGDVFLKLYGENGESEEVELTDDMDRSWNKFERGDTDVFNELLKDVGQVIINTDLANEFVYQLKKEAFRFALVCLFDCVIRIVL